MVIHAAAALPVSHRAALRTMHSLAEDDDHKSVTRACRAFYSLLHMRSRGASGAQPLLQTLVFEHDDDDSGNCATLDVAAQHYKFVGHNIALLASVTVSAAFRIVYAFDLNFRGPGNEVILDCVVSPFDHVANVRVDNFRLEHPPGRAVLLGTEYLFSEYSYVFPPTHAHPGWGGEAGRYVGYKRLKAEATSILCFAHALQSGLQSRSRLPLCLDNNQPQISWLLSAFPEQFWRQAARA